MTADTGKAREALADAILERYFTRREQAEEDADHLLSGPLSDPAVVAALPGAAGLVRELAEAREKLARVEEIAGMYSKFSRVGMAIRAALASTP